MEYVNLETGEIIIDAFEVVPVDFSVMFKDSKFGVSPSNSTDAEMLKEQCLSVGEKQTHEPHVNISLYKEALKKDYCVVSKLINLIKYRNIVFINIKELCDVFGLDDNKNLDRKLKQLSKRNIIQYSKVNRSQYKLCVNPRIFYRGKHSTYLNMCAKTEWELDGKPQTPKELYVEYVFDVTKATMEKEMLWSENDDKVQKVIEELGYYDVEEYEKCVGKDRINKVLGCNLQEFITKYIN